MCKNVSGPLSRYMCLCSILKPSEADSPKMGPEHVYFERAVSDSDMYPEVIQVWFHQRQCRATWFNSTSVRRHPRILVAVTPVSAHKLPFAFEKIV